jgi:hypothetical protein
VQQVARRLSALAAAHAALRAVGRNTLAPQPVGVDSALIDTPNHQPPEPTMNHLPATANAVRLNALLAAAIVTLTLLLAIDTLAVAQNAAAQLAQAGVTQPA